MAVDDIYTKLLLHMDGDNNGTVFTDESGKTVTRVGNTCTKTDHCLRDVTKGKTYYASSSYDSSWLPANAFNDNLSTGWHSLNNANNEWIAVDLGTGNTCVFDALSFIPRFYENTQVKDFTFYGSNDSTNGADGSWTQIGTGTHVNSATWQLFNFTNSVAYRWAKVVCNTSYRTNFLGGSIIEMEIGTIDKKFGTATAYFDGSGDNLSVTNSAEELSFGTGDFTIDCWIYLLQIKEQMIYASATAGDISWGFSSSGLMVLAVRDMVELGSIASGIVINTWNHVAVVRNNGVVSFYVNGIKLVGFNSSYNLKITNILTIGSCGTKGYFYGYIDEFRVSKGVARWTENFTPPTEQYYPKIFKSSGTILFNPIPLPIDKSLTSKVSWTHNMPFGTNITILTAISSGIPDEEDYEIVTNGGLTSKFFTSSNQSLYIKGLFETTDVINTPELLSLNCELLEEKNEKIIITLTDADRMKYPIGNVIVSFVEDIEMLPKNNTIIEDFSMPFVPTGISKVFNPNDLENITTGISTVLTTTEVIYNYAQQDVENLTSQISSSIVVTKVGTLPL